MSKSEDAKTVDPARRALADLDGAVGRILTELEVLRGRLKESEKRTGDVEELLRRFTKGDVDPGSLQGSVEQLRSENSELRERIEQGRAGVEKILARIRFLEEHG